MKCPLQLTLVQVGSEFTTTSERDCIKEECGQWDKDQKCCSEVSKARAEWALVKVLQEIRDKMPPARRTKKGG